MSAPTSPVVNALHDDVLTFIDRAFVEQPDMTPFRLCNSMLHILVREKLPAQSRGLVLQALDAVMFVALENCDRALFRDKLSPALKTLIAEKLEKHPLKDFFDLMMTATAPKP